jgi:hypothetical protein
MKTINRFWQGRKFTTRGKKTLEEATKHIFTFYVPHTIHDWRACQITLNLKIKRNTWMFLSKRIFKNDSTHSIWIIIFKRWSEIPEPYLNGTGLATCSHGGRTGKIQIFCTKQEPRNSRACQETQELETKDQNTKEDDTRGSKQVTYITLLAYLRPDTILYYLHLVVHYTTALSLSL